jgi:FixJ family two-component response regulator
MPTAPVVAIINTSEDVVTMLSALLESEGFQPVTGFVPEFREERQDLAAFLREHEPAVVLWDIALPYDVNWQYLQDVQASGVMQDCPLVLTTTNKRVLEALVGPTPTLEIVGKPYDIDEIVTAVQRAAGTA